MDSHFANMRSLIQVSAVLSVCGGWAWPGLLISQVRRLEVGPEMSFIWKLSFYVFVYQGAGLELQQSCSASVTAGILACTTSHSGVSCT